MLTHKYVKEGCYTLQFYESQYKAFYINTNQLRKGVIGPEV